MDCIDDMTDDQLRKAIDIAKSIGDSESALYMEERLKSRHPPLETKTGE